MTTGVAGGGCDQVGAEAGGLEGLAMGRGSLSVLSHHQHMHGQVVPCPRRVAYSGKPDLLGPAFRLAGGKARALRCDHKGSLPIVSTPHGSRYRRQAESDDTPSSASGVFFLRHDGVYFMFG